MAFNEKPNPIANLLHSRATLERRWTSWALLDSYQKTSFLLIFIMFYKWNNSLMIEIRRKKQFSRSFPIQDSVFGFETEITTFFGREESLTFESSAQLSVRLIGAPASVGPSDSSLFGIWPLLSRTVLFISESDKKFVVLLYEIYISWHSRLGSEHRQWVSPSVSQFSSLKGLKVKLIIYYSNINLFAVIAITWHVMNPILRRSPVNWKPPDSELSAP